MKRADDSILLLKFMMQKNWFKLAALVRKSTADCMSRIGVSCVFWRGSGRDKHLKSWHKQCAKYKLESKELKCAKMEADEC